MKKYTIAAVVVTACLTALSFALAGEREYIPVAKTADLETVYIESVEQRDHQYRLSVDQVDWYEGEEATRMFLEREGDAEMEGPPDGYYVINDDSTLKTMPIADDAVVLMQIYNRTGNIAEADIVWDEQITVEKFIELINMEDDLQLKNFPYHLTVKDGEIVRIVQQYVP